MEEARSKSNCVIEPVSGYEQSVGTLLAMLDAVRGPTVQVLRGLTQAELDHHIDGFSNTIGMLLSHIIASEASCILQTLRIDPASAIDMSRWSAGVHLWDRARHEIKGLTAEDYREALLAIRSLTAAQFRPLGSTWLERSVEHNGVVRNNHWIWFHLMEDEASHRGQMRMIRYHLPTRLNEAIARLMPKDA